MDGSVAQVDAALTADAEQGALPSECTGSCAQMSLTAAFSLSTQSFDRAFFGLESPAQSASGQWEVYIEAGSGADAACPSKASPTPRFLFIVSGSTPGTQVGEEAGPVAANLIDFAGELATEILSRSTARSMKWVAADLCIACAEGSEADRDSRMLAADISATFAEGSIEGHVYATHCDSLDKL